MRATPKGEKSCLWQVFSDDRRRLQSIGLNIEIALQTARTNSLWCTRKRRGFSRLFCLTTTRKWKGARMRATPKGEKSCLRQVFSDDRRRLQSIGSSIEIALQTARTNSLWCTNKKGEVFLVFFVWLQQENEKEWEWERRRKAKKVACGLRCFFVVYRKGFSQ